MSNRQVLQMKNVWIVIPEGNTPDDVFKMWRELPEHLFFEAFQDNTVRDVDGKPDQKQLEALVRGTYNIKSETTLNFKY